MTVEKITADLATWSEETRDFHKDRNLGDRVLLATGWTCAPDPDHPAKVKWQFGTNPIVTVWEPHHPHPLNSLDAAMGQLPFGWRICRMDQRNQGDTWYVYAVRDGAMVDGFHKSLHIALCIAAVLAWRRDA
jgi:hypothetical protein